MRKFPDLSMWHSLGLTKAMQLEHAGRADAYCFLRVIFAAILGWLIFYEVPTPTTFLGVLFIIGGVLVNVFYQDSCR